jgi:hypothetical protein
MAVLSVQDEFQSGDNVTATNLNNLVKDASFNADTTDNSTLEVHTTGYLKVKDLGVDTQHLADGAVETAKIGDDQVTTAKIGDDEVTYAKMQDVAAYSVIGNNTNATATPAAISIDDLKDNISNATQTADGLMSSADKTKLDGIDAGAEVNVQSDWNQTTTTADDFIKNKPNIAYTSAISNATAHNATPDSNGLNTTGGADGLFSAGDKTKLDGLAAGSGLKLTGSTFSLDDSAPSSITSAPNGITGGAMTAYRPAGGGVSTQVAGGWFHYGNAQVEFDPTIFFDAFGNKVPASANWALITFMMTSTGLDSSGNVHSYPAEDVSVALVPLPPQGTSFDSRNTIVRREDQAGQTVTSTGQSLNNSQTVGSWASAGGTYTFSSGYQFTATNLINSGGVTNLATVIVPINHNGNRRSVQLEVQFTRDSSGNAVNQYESSGWNMWFAGYLL